MDLDSISELVRYGDNANDLLLAEYQKLSPDQLDRPLDLGMGSARKIAQHLLAGEVTWLARAQGNAEANWPAKPIPDSPADLAAEFRANAKARQQFLASLAPDHLRRTQNYRDSKGSLFQATLQQMLLQTVIHATHHRAQLVNAIRRVGGTPPEVDYMASVRRPA